MVRVGQPCQVVVGIMLCFSVALSIGCGSGNEPTYPVAGTVRFPDQSFPKFGIIEFYHPQLQLNARGEINRDGSFTVSTFETNDGAVAGEHQIAIIQNTGDYLTARLDSNIKHDHGDLVSSKYLDYRTSGLQCKIEPGENQVNLLIEKRPQQSDDGMPKQ